MALRIGQVIVTEVNRKHPFSRLIAARTGCSATHSMMYVGRGMAIEARFPTVRWTPIEATLAHLREQDRAYAVLDVPGITGYQRANVAWQVMQYVGRIYDVGQVLLFALTGKFWNDGPGTMVCSRAETAAFWEGAGIDLFDAATLAKHYAPGFARLDNLREGACVPGDLLKSKLEVVDFVPSSTIRDAADFLQS